MSSAKRLLPQDWAIAALAAIAEEGIKGLSVERLAKSIGVTKGSFYWHFADRSALLLAAAEAWERQATDDVISELVAVSDPAQRLRSLFEASFGDGRMGSIDAALAGHAEDALIGSIVQRATGTRVAFLVDIFTELGFTPSVASERARIAYSAYLGHFPMLTGLGEHPDAVPATYLDNLVALLTEDLGSDPSIAR